MKNTFIGQPLKRVEDARFVAGRGRYVNDVDYPGLVHAKILRSAVAHGRIVSIDTAPAKQRPGVVDVITAQMIGTPMPTIPIRMAGVKGQESFQQPVIATDKVRFVGEPLAVVVARSAAEAEEAIEAIDVKIDPLPVVIDPSRPPDAVLFDASPANLCVTYKVKVGETDAAFKIADYIRAESFQVHRHSAIPMETRGLVAACDAGRLRVWGAAKVPYFNRRQLAIMLGMPLDDVELIEVDVGGGFGVRGEFYPEDFLIPFAAKQLGLPVKWIEDRRDHFMSANHSRDVSCELEIACRRDGTILALRGRVVGDLGAYLRTTGIVVPSRAAQFLPGPYRIPSLEFDVAGAMTNKTPGGSFRGPGRFEANFFRERLFDIAARELGLDPIEFRRRNLLTAAELPYDYGRLVPYDEPVIYDSGDYHAVFDRCLAEIGWVGKAALQGRQIDGRYHGLGICCSVESGGSGKENARITVAADATVSVAVGSSGVGQGIETTFGQIAADALGLPLQRIRIIHDSTSRLEEGFGTFHGRTMIMGGSAVVRAAANLIDALRAAAAARFGCKPNDVQVEDGRLTGPDGRNADFASFATEDTPFQADGAFATPERAYSYGTHAAHVAVDPQSGVIEVLDYVAVDDVGRMINPMIVHGQKVGAIVQGLGGVMLEHLVYDEDGQLLTGSFMDYAMPRAAHFPNVRAISLEISPSPHNPLGVKGAGEDGIIPVGATIANAVAAALQTLGYEPVSLPLSPARVWQLIRARAPADGGTIEACPDHRL
jgi:aerobic carbon-monoxide dehydrogenase large subunit